MIHNRMLLLPGNEVTAITETVQEPQLEERNPDDCLYGPFEVTFENNYQIRVWVINSDPPVIQSALYDQSGELLDGPVVAETAELDQDYVFIDGPDQYEMRISRAANTVITDDELTTYVEAGGGHCPCCGCDDIHHSSFQVDGQQASRGTECLNCGANWKDIFQLQTVSRDAEDFRAPTRNVRRPS